MSGLRFKVGEMAIFAVARKKSGEKYAGSLVTIEYVGPFSAGFQIPTYNPLPEPKDYLISAPDGAMGGAMDWQLVKLGDPDQQIEQEEECEVTA